MRQLVWASLPLGKGRILDPFCGGGSTLAAAEFFGYESVGIEIDAQYYEFAKKAVPKLAALDVEISSLKHVSTRKEQAVQSRLI